MCREDSSKLHSNMAVRKWDWDSYQAVRTLKYANSVFLPSTFHYMKILYNPKRYPNPRIPLGYLCHISESILFFRIFFWVYCSSWATLSCTRTSDNMPYVTLGDLPSNPNPNPDIMTYCDKLHKNLHFRRSIESPIRASRVVTWW